MLELDSSGLTPLLLPVSLTIVNAAPTVTASLVIAPAAGWTPGMALPTGTLTVKSSGDPVLFTVSAPPASTGGTSWINLSAPSAVAYSWGTPIGVTFAQAAFDNPTVGALLSGTIVVKAGCDASDDQCFDFGQCAVVHDFVGYAESFAAGDSRRYRSHDRGTGE